MDALTTESERLRRGEQPILQRIRELVDTERSLRDSVAEERMDTAEEQARLADVERELDQCWDLLRRRRAREEYGQDPDATGIRPASEVENYLS